MLDGSGTVDVRRSGGYNRRYVSIRELREERGMSLRDLQSETGINRAVWSQIERGLLMPGPLHLAMLGRTFGVPVYEFRMRFVVEVPA